MQQTVYNNCILRQSHLHTLTHAQLQTHLHTYTDRQIYTQHTFTHTHIPGHKQTLKYTKTHNATGTQTRRYQHSHTYTYTHIPTQTRALSRPHRYWDIHTSICMHRLERNLFTQNIFEIALSNISLPGYWSKNNTMYCNDNNTSHSLRRNYYCIHRYLCYIFNLTRREMAYTFRKF